MIRLAMVAFLFLIGTPKSANGTKMDWKHSLEGFVVRCFEPPDLKVHCEDLAASEEHLVREELQIDAKDPSGQLFSYIYGKGIEGDLCQGHLKKIKGLLRKVDQVCVSGFSEQRIPDGSIVVRWRGLESKRGEVVW